MTDRDPEATLREWKASMQAEHEQSIHAPDPEADHRIGAVAQVSYEVTYALDGGELVETARERVADGDPELFSCVCGVRGMTREEALTHLQALD
ncbi:hypothetical protein [Natronomonas sp. EA1]|uniref:hypothetical protein n=1 Tax=Natronomonas sp. EA1 TaxID=3421655 RepID=UPI003EB7FCA1